VALAEAIPGVSGVRLWRMASGEPVVWRQTGAISALEGRLAVGLVTDGATAAAREARWTGPLSTNGQILGFLEVAGSSLPPSAQSLLENLVEIAAAALGQAEEQQTARDLSTILEATKLLNSTLDLPELLDIILQLSTALCGADRGTVFLLDRKQNEIWSLKGLGLDRHEIRLPIGRGIAGWVALHGETVRAEDASADPRFDPAVDRDLGYHTRELIALAIRNEADEIVGVLELLNKQSGPFTVSDEKSLNHLCVYVALALEKAQLHRVILAKQRIEDDLELARSVQEGFLPEDIPEIEGLQIAVAYTASSMVGGDYYDFMRIKPGSWLAVIADVEGKGVASALMMASLQASLRALAPHVHALESIVQSVNDMVLSHTRARKLLSMFVAVIDERTRALHYINAGHVPPVLIRQDGEAARLEEGGILLGVFRDAAYKRGRVELSPGDILAAYTDGITEAADVHGEQFGLERTVDLVRSHRAAPAEEIVKTVLSEVDRLSVPNGDDRVMLVLKAK
jgi:phosphoserine phosphatase RsbU/P